MTTFSFFVSVMPQIRKYFDSLILSPQLKAPRKLSICQQVPNEAASTINIPLSRPVLFLIRKEKTSMSITLFVTLLSFSISVYQSPLVINSSTLHVYLCFRVLCLVFHFLKKTISYNSKWKKKWIYESIVTVGVIFPLACQNSLQKIDPVQQKHDTCLFVSRYFSQKCAF